MEDANFLGLAMIVIALVAAWVALGFGRAAWKKYDAARVTVYEYEQGVRFREGRITETLGPGRYPTWPEQISISRIDMREQSVAIPGQESLTADRMSVRLSVVAAYRVADPRLYFTASTNAAARLYQIVQFALRERVAARTLDDALADRGALVAGLADEIAAEISALGLALNSVRLLDVTLAGPAKQAFADIWKAQKEGLAALERARGEQAGLRALANAARQLKGNPELMNLRLLQALSGAPGKAPPTIVLGGGAGLLPVSKDAAEDRE